MKRPDDAAYWSRLARRYDRTTLWLNRRLPTLARDLARRLEGASSVLEVAAGTGLITQATSRSASRYVATDLSPEMLDVLKARLPDVQGLETRPADLMHLHEPDATYDAVVAANVLHLLPDDRAALRELGRVLEVDGLLMAPTFCHHATLRSRLVSRVLRLSGFPLEHAYSGGDLERRIASTGFEILSASWVPGLLPIRAVVARKTAD